MEALRTSNGVKTHTAALLGIDRRNLGYFLQKHGIHTPLLLICWGSIAGI